MMKKVQKTKHTTTKPVENPVENTADTPVDDSAENQARQEALAQIDVLTADLQRTRADFENFRKQVDLQKAQARDSARFATVAQVLPLLDDMSRALSTYPEQLAPLSKSFTKTLKDLKLEMMNTAPETPFDPDFHEAVMVEESDGKHEVIAETLRPGYLFEGQVLRPAMVKVKRI